LGENGFAPYHRDHCTGQRGVHIYLKMDDASQIPAIAEPFFLWLHADVSFNPVMRPADLAKGDPGIKSAIKHWG